MENETVIQPRIGQNHATVANGSYLTCKKHSFSFAGAKARFKAKTERKEKMVEDIGGAPSGFKQVFSLIAVAVSLGLACLEAGNTQNVISASTGLSETLTLVVGFLFSAMGMLCGEMLSHVKKDEFTGRWKLTAKWWAALALTIIYVTGQYFLASSAETAATGDMQATVHNMTFYILGICIAEVLFGLLFVKTAIEVVSLMSLTLRIRLSIQRMKTTSRNTEEAWQRHLFEVNTHNEAHNTNVPHGEEVQSIQDAREYYNSGGFV